VGAVRALNEVRRNQHAAGVPGGIDAPLPAFTEVAVSDFKKHHEFVSAVALLVACAFSTSCTAWHTIPLQPQRFSADTSPERGTKERSCP
jgi:hypothetical protein